MTVYTPLSLFSVGLFTTLNVSAVTTLANGGVHDSIPQSARFPMVLYDVSEIDESAFGSHPGSGIGSIVRVRLRCSIYSTFDGMAECQAILTAIKNLLKTPFSVTGYNVPAVFYLQAIPVGDELVAGVKVKELTADWEFHVEEAA